MSSDQKVCPCLRFHRLLMMIVVSKRPAGCSTASSIATLTSSVSCRDQRKPHRDEKKKLRSTTITDTMAVNKDDTKIPEEYYCALTKKVMKEPMVSRYGTHFEREAIMEWLQKGNNYCPVTGQALRPSNLVTDRNLQWKIQYWAEKNGREDLICKPEDEESAAAKIQVTGALPPKYMICPITKDIMKDPVMTKYGDSYERAAILRKLDKEGDKDPSSGKELHPSELVTNHKLAFEIKQWNLHYGEAYDEMTRLEVETKTVKATMISQGFQTADILKALVLEHAGEEKEELLEEDDRKMSATDVLNAFDEIDDIVG